MVASFLDMSKASAGKIIKEAARNESLTQEAKDAFQGLADLERSRCASTKKKGYA